MKRVSVIVLVSVIIAACSAKSFAPTSGQLVVMQNKVPGITLENAEAGYKLFSDKCSGCHQLYRPNKYSITQWNRILPKMFPKAKVSSEEQQKLVRDYLYALSK